MLTLLAIDEAGAEYSCFAPDWPQAHVVDHTAGTADDANPRSVLVESARIARGAIQPLSACNAADFDALIVPGGFGAAKNLCDYAFKGADMAVRPEVATCLQQFNAAGKPIGVLCIAPVIAAKVFANQNVALTIGNDADTAGHIESWGARHVAAAVHGVVADDKLKVFSSPAYMLAQSIGEVRSSTQNLVKAVIAAC